MGEFELTDPCKDCLNRIEDDWGLVCDLSCGKAAQYTIVQATLKAVGKDLEEWLSLAYDQLSPIERQQIQHRIRHYKRGEMPSA